MRRWSWRMSSTTSCVWGMGWYSSGAGERCLIRLPRRSRSSTSRSRPFRSAPGGVPPGFRGTRGCRRSKAQQETVKRSMLSHALEQGVLVLSINDADVADGADGADGGRGALLTDITDLVHACAPAPVVIILADPAANRTALGRRPAGPPAVQQPRHHDVRGHAQRPGPL